MKWITHGRGHTVKGASPCVCAIICLRSMVGGGQEGRCLYMSPCVCVCACHVFFLCVCVLVNLNLKGEAHVYLHAYPSLRKHCSTAQCAPLTFRLHLSARTKASLRAPTCVNLLPVTRDSTVHCRTHVGGQHAESCLTPSL